MKKHPPFLAILLLAGCLIALRHASAAQAAPSIPNPSFETGGNAPSGWTPSAGGPTQWENTGHTGGRSISVSATPPGDSLYWKCDDLPLKPNQLYRFSFWSKEENEADGCIISGFSSVNHDFAFSGSQWTFHSIVFVTPSRLAGNYLRLGQWNATGKVYFDDVNLQETLPLYSQTNGAALGGGESVSGDVYRYATSLPASNFSRTLQSSTAAFNTNRWAFSGDGQVVYQHQLDNVTQQSAQISVETGYYQSGQLLVEASRDGSHWLEVGRASKAGQLKADLPATLFPASSIQVRLRAVGAATGKGDSAPGSLQVNSYQYTAKLAGHVPDAQGSTQFLSVEKSDPQVDVNVLSLGSLLPGASAAQIAVAGTQNQPVQARLTLQQAGAGPLVFEAAANPANSTAISIPYNFSKTGDWQARLEVSQNQKMIYAASADFSVPSLYAADYGKRLAGSDDLWWCGSAHKIGQERPLPPVADQSAFVPIQLARNEYEAIQIVANPQKDIAGVTAKSSDLSGPGGAKIAASLVTIDQVAYVPVTHATDATGAAGNWPDPLPPFNKPLTLKAGENQPFWITVFAPKNVPAGTYTGNILFSGEGWRREVPLRVTVWNFTLSDQTHVKSALGLSAGRIAPYHHVSGDDLRKLMDKYYADFAAHRISPYDPVYGANIKVDWGLGNPPQQQGAQVTPEQVKVDFTAFDKAMESAIAKYHITTFRLGIQGTGYRPDGPDSYAPGQVGNYKQGSPEYNTLFGSYVKQLQDHFEEKGWLDKAYLYWFDEPGPGAYKQIAAMGDLIHRYAPKLKWMLTEQPEPELEHSVDIFCPLLNLYDHPTAAGLQQQGKEIWWYICTGPKAPYVGEFIDRAALEPRLWLWQTWKNKVQGILIWATVYWTSHAAYPDSLQNPWQDPESWSTNGGPWGNGDGRFLYPPRRDPNTDKTPNMDAPIDSIRWENLRDGIEDYEYFWTLQQQVDALRQKKNLDARAKSWLAAATGLLQVPDSISTSLTDFPTGPEALMTRRAQIAGAIVEGRGLAE